MQTFISRRIFILSLVLISQSAFAQKELQTQLTDISKEIDGVVGIGILNLKTGEKCIINADHQFPMQSVFKFPIGMAILDAVDKGKLKLDQKIHLTQKDYFTKTYSPMRDKYPDAEVDVTLAEVLTYTVSLSDNIGCDILLRLLGGPEAVNSYIQSLGVRDISIVANEEQMHLGWETQFKNGCKPVAMLQILEVFYKGKNLSVSSSEFLWKMMTDTPTGPKRIKGQLPQSIVLTHKTGTSGTNAAGLTAAVNDVGILKLPGGEDIAIVAYVSNTKAGTEAAELVIAKIGKATADFYSKK